MEVETSRLVPLDFQSQLSRLAQKFAEIVAPTLFAMRLQIGFEQALDGVEIQKVKHFSQTRLAGEYNLGPIVILVISLL